MKVRFLLLICAAVFFAACSHDHDHQDGDASAETHSHGGEAHSHGGEAHSHGDENHDETDDHGHDHGPPSRVVTAFSQNYELFMEYELPASGRDFQLIIHLTKRAAWRPVLSGPVQLTFTKGEGQKVELVKESPDRPGIFVLTGNLQEMGRWNLNLTYQGETFLIDDFHVALTPGGLIQPEGPGEETITFLKEQQWRVDFKVEPVGTRVVGDSVSVFAQLKAAPGQKVSLKAPVNGVLVTAGTGKLQPGMRVQKGDPVIAVLAAPAEIAAPDDLEANAIRLRAEIKLAEAEIKRLESLLEAGVIAAYRVESARTRLTGLEAELDAVSNKTDILRGRGEGNWDRTTSIRAPFSGVVTAVHYVPGTYIEQGEAIIEILNRDQIRLEALVPETQIHRVDKINALSVEMGGHNHHLHLDGEVRLVYMGAELSPTTRTFPVVFEIPNHDDTFVPGTTVKLELIRDEGPKKVAVPEKALVFDGGMRVLFVQVDGEHFERRLPELGASSEGFIEVKSGVEVGERVVTEGAYLVRLATMNSGEAGHGHAH